MNEHLFSERDSIEEMYQTALEKKNAREEDQSLFGKRKSRETLDKMDRKQYLNQHLNDVLRERNFERIDMCTWIFTFPKRIDDPERWIMLTMDNLEEVRVNINDEYVFKQSPQDLLNALYFRFYGYGNAR